LFDTLEEKRAYILSQRGRYDNVWESLVLAVCIDCFKAFAPGVVGATAFLCAECAERS
jgi:hypothetical protein